MEGRELRRSYTQVEFPVTSRQRQHQQQSQHHQHHHYQQVRPLGGKRYQQMTSATAARGKFPTMEIYRPPNLRESGSPIAKSSLADSRGGKLNVYAKEFVMSSPLQPSKSTGSILTAVENSSKHNVKSILHGMNKNNQPTISGHHQPIRNVQFNEKILTDKTMTTNSISGRDLKKSKSTGSAVSSLLILPSPFSTTISLVQELALFNGHPAEKLIKKSCLNAEVLTCEELIELPTIILEKALDDRAHAQSYATIAMTIIERETGGTFLESLLNICQYTCEKKKSLKGGENGSKFHSFIAFLNELYSQMKPKYAHLKLSTGSNPTQLILSLIVQVCQAILSQKTLAARAEIECLFFTVTTTGRDIEMEDPKLLDTLMWAVRDAFLSPGTSHPNKQTLLQLIELKAAKWHLPGSTIMYYKSHAI